MQVEAPVVHQVITLKYNRVFKEANESKKRYVVFKGSAGSGKSTNIAQDYIKKFSTTKGRNLLVVRKVAATHRDSTLAELVKAVKGTFGDYADEVWQYPKTRTATMYMKCLLTGTEIVFRGCATKDDIQKIKSINFENGKLTDIWVEEGSELLANELEILDDRLRGELPEGLYYQMKISFNPVPCFLKERFYDHTDPQAFLCHSTYKDNRFIDKAYYDRMEQRKLIDPEGYRIYGEGEWGEIGGLIFKNVVIEDFDINQFDRKVYGQDFGYNHANVILEVGYNDPKGDDPVGDIWICSEMVRYEKDTAEIIAEAKQLGLNQLWPMFCDSAEPDRIKMWRKAGFAARPVKKEPGSVNAQIDWLKGIISKDQVVKRTIHIHSSCPHTIKEIQQYRWIKDEVRNEYTDVPIKVFDDAMAALRYSIEIVRRPRPKISF